MNMKVTVPRDKPCSKTVVALACGYQREGAGEARRKVRGGAVGRGNKSCPADFLTREFRN